MKFSLGYESYLARIDASRRLASAEHVIGDGFFGVRVFALLLGSDGHRNGVVHVGRIAAWGAATVRRVHGTLWDICLTH